MSRVIIGTGADYHVAPGADAAAAFRSALSDGHRWLVLTGVSDGSNHNLPYVFSTATSGKCVNLDSYRGGQSIHLRIEGPGAGLSPIRRAVNATLIYSGGSAITDLSYLTFTGLTFDGAGFASSYPLCEFKGIDHSYFEDCEFLDSAADGLSMGGGFQASATRFIHCRFNDNGGNGLTVLKGIDHTFVGGESKNNGRHGIFWQSATAQQGARGAGVFMGMRFGPGNVDRDLYLVDAVAMRVMNCEFDGGLVTFQATKYCMFENNYSVNGARFSGGAPDDIAEHNYPPTPWT